MDANSVRSQSMRPSGILTLSMQFYMQIRKEFRVIFHQGKDRSKCKGLKRKDLWIYKWKHRDFRSFEIIGIQGRRVRSNDLRVGRGDFSWVGFEFRSLRRIRIWLRLLVCCLEQSSMRRMKICLNFKTCKVS